MRHLSFNSTPCTVLPFFSKKYGLTMYAKRDDLFEEAGGGSKARMLQYILGNKNLNNYDLLLTAGGAGSNFNRACALMCAKLGIKMTLVEYASDEVSREREMNHLLCKLAGVQIVPCLKYEVAEKLEYVRRENSSQRILEIYGGGRSLEGIYAYFDAVCELRAQMDKIDHLFVACGTGTTLAGITAGMQEYFPNACVHGISISRSKKDEMKILQEDVIMLNKYLKRLYDFKKMKFYDEFLCGGYNKKTIEIISMIKECVSREGMIVDHCYSGKALWGTTQIIRENQKEFQGKIVVFWNTGGVFNLLS